MIQIKGNQFQGLVVLIIISWAIKLLLIPAYYSTDFAVHQNWLRITHNHPLEQWYFNDDSKWTLDYPPFFAFFEYILAAVASLINPAITSRINESQPTVYFQRVSVIFTDLLYLFSLIRFAPTTSNALDLAKISLLYLSPCFLLLDNIHFQYNIFLQAILIASIGLLREKKFLWAAFVFSVLLNFKHIYLYCAPAYFIYLLVCYVMYGDSKEGNWLIRLFKLGGVTLVPFFMAFFMFFVKGGIDGIEQILARLFPFGRGLVHEYWAPNFWALYHFADKIFQKILKNSVSFQIHSISSEESTQNTNIILKALPSISPILTISIILILLVPVFIKVFNTKDNLSKQNVPMLICLSGMIFFFFGFHVHEKAITPYLNVLMLFCSHTRMLNAAIFVNLVNLLPLLISPGEKVLSILLCLIWMQLWSIQEQRCKVQAQRGEEEEDLSLSFDKQSRMKQEITNILSNPQRMLSNPVHYYFLENSTEDIIKYVIKFSGLFIVLFHSLVHPLISNPAIQFLPLMMNSVWAAGFNLLWGAYLYISYLRA